MTSSLALREATFLLGFLEDRAPVTRQKADDRCVLARSLPVGGVGGTEEEQRLFKHELWSKEI